MRFQSCSLSLSFFAHHCKLWLCNLHLNWTGFCYLIHFVSPYQILNSSSLLQYLAATLQTNVSNFFFQLSWFGIVENTKLTAQILIGSLRFVFIGSKEVLWAEARQLDINFKGLIIVADYVWSSCLKLLPCGPLRKFHFISHALLQEIIMIVDDLTKTYLMSLLHRKHSLKARKSIRLPLPSPQSTI